MPHVIRQPGVLVGTRIAVFLASVHAVDDVLTAISIPAALLALRASRSAR